MQRRSCTLSRYFSLPITEEIDENNADIKQSKDVKKWGNKNRDPANAKRATRQCKLTVKSTKVQTLNEGYAYPACRLIVSR